MSPLMMRLFALVALAIAASMQLKARADTPDPVQARQPAAAVHTQARQP
jgi:hypothetical protein